MLIIDDHNGPLLTLWNSVKCISNMCMKMCRVFIKCWIILLNKGVFRFKFRFKIALLLPIKHRIIYITVKSTWNVNTSTNTAMHYHGSKGSWKSCGIYGLLVCYTISKYISTGVQRVQQKKKVTQNDNTSNYVSTTHAVHDFNTVQLK